jgi:MFS family permease
MRRSLAGLSGVNFFVAAVQTGFGAFVTVYLVKSQWPPQAIGLALSIGTLSNLASQIPAGAFIDSIADKRRAVWLGIIGIGLAALLLGLSATRPAVYGALALQGLASSLIGPGIAAISLALVGPAALAERIGHNARFASIGNGLTAGLMGIVGAWLPPVSVFLVAAALALPALFSLSLIARGGVAPPPDGGAAPRRAGGEITWTAIKRLALDPRLAIFGACVVLFFAASAAVGPAIAARVTHERPDFATLVVAATILLPQAIVAAISPWIGRRAERAGRRPLMLIGWGLVPLQALTFLVPAGPAPLVVCCLLNAVSGAIFGVMMPVVAADLTRGRGGFNFTLGALGVAVAAGASLSTLLAGAAVGAFGAKAAASGLALIGLAGLLLLWAGMPETRAAAAARENPAIE